MAKLDRDEERRRGSSWVPLPEVTGNPVPGEKTPQQPAQPEPLPEVEHWDRERFERETNRQFVAAQILPRHADTPPVSFLWPAGEDDGPALPQSLELARRDSFPRWKSFADEFVVFFYPDEPGYSVVEVTGDAGHPPLVAPEMWSRPPGTFREYRVDAAGRGTLFGITLAHSSSFDDSPRAPHPPVFHRFLESGAGLLRASFTDRGQARHVEVLGHGVRVTVHDWPNLAVHHDVYLRMALAVRLRGAAAGADVEALRRAAIDRYGFAARLGSIDHGLPEGALLAALGEPAARDRERGILRYEVSGAGGDTVTYQLPIRGGIFTGFADGWRAVERRPPHPGTLRWMVEKSSYHAGPPGGIGYDLGALADDDAREIYAAIAARGRSASEAEWRQMCAAIANLAQHGLNDGAPGAEFGERIVAIARARLGADADPAPSLLALAETGTDMALGTVANYLNEQLAAGGEPAEDELEHAYTLLSLLGSEHPGSRQAIDLALRHPSAGVRQLGYAFCDWLGDEHAIPHLVAGLRDSSAAVRIQCADAFADGSGDPHTHQPLLAERLAREPDERVRERLERAIERLGVERARGG